MTDYMSEPCCRCGAPTRGIYVRFKPSECKNQHDGWTHALCDECWKHHPNADRFVPHRVLKERGS